MVIAIWVGAGRDLRAHQTEPNTAPASVIRPRAERRKTAQGCGLVGEQCKIRTYRAEFDTAPALLAQLFGHQPALPLPPRKCERGVARGCRGRAVGTRGAIFNQAEHTNMVVSRGRTEREIRSHRTAAGTVPVPHTSAAHANAHASPFDTTSRGYLTLGHAVGHCSKTLPF